MKVKVYMTSYGKLFQYAHYPGIEVLLDCTAYGKNGPEYELETPTVGRVVFRLNDRLKLLGEDVASEITDKVAAEISRSANFAVYTDRFGGEFIIYAPHKVVEYRVQSRRYLELPLFIVEKVTHDIPEEPPLYVDIPEIDAYDVKLEALSAEGIGEYQVYLIKVDKRSYTNGYKLEEGWYIIMVS